MTKQELIGKIAEGADITKAEAERALKVLLASVESEPVEHGELSLVKWSVAARNARKGRNPSTGDNIEFSAKQVVRFRPGKKLAEAVR
jgi:DNA-binding protein HU-beta